MPGQQAGRRADLARCSRSAACPIDPQNVTPLNVEVEPMPDDTPQHPPDLDTALAQLQQKLSDTAIILNITQEMRRNAQRVTALLGDQLTSVRDAINAVLPLLPMAGLVLLGPGGINTVVY
jgi:hypothetical protein